MTVFHNLLSIVSFLHKNEIAHLDLKPENFVFDNSMRLKVLDF